MLYLLDANVLIEANDEYYPVDRIPQFWDWIIANAKQNRIKMPYEMLAEVKAGPPNKDIELDEDELVRWLRRDEHEQSLLYRATADAGLVNKVFAAGYELPNPSTDELRKIRKDPLLIAYALAISDVCIVTLESKQENKTDTMKRHKRSIPFVCRKLGIRSIDTFDLIRELDFRIP